MQNIKRRSTSNKKISRPRYIFDFLSKPRTKTNSQTSEVTNPLSMPRLSLLTIYSIVWNTKNYKNLNVIATDHRSLVIAGLK